MKVTGIFIYPIKSCQGISLTEAQITPKGLSNNQKSKIYDRQFMLIDEKGKFLTQRQYPQLATIKVKIVDNDLYLSTENNYLPEFKLTPSEDKKLINVNIWRDETIAIDQGDKIANWFKQVLKIDINCRLVKQSNSHIRPINSQYTLKKNHPVSFSDGFPFLLTNTASLVDLNHRLAHKYNHQIQVTMDRFRSNIIIETNNPFMEDSWQNIYIGNIKFALVKPCSRCVITTTDQKTGLVNSLKEPLLTLSTFRNTSAGIMFGQNMIALQEGIVKINDQVTDNS